MLTLGNKDKAVIWAFANRTPVDGNKLSTDGHRLDGHWMGGSGIAEWVPVGKHTYKIRFNDLGSRSAQTVQRAIKKMVAPHDLFNGRGY